MTAAEFKDVTRTTPVVAALLPEGARRLTRHVRSSSGMSVAR